MDLDNIRFYLRERQFEFSKHALERAVLRDISEDEIWEAGASLELIEDYPDDKYSPSCLVLGFAVAGRPLHLQVCYTEGGVKIITLNEPEGEEWIEFRKRRI